MAWASIASSTLPALIFHEFGRQSHHPAFGDQVNLASNSGFSERDVDDAAARDRAIGHQNQLSSILTRFLGMMARGPFQTTSVFFSAAAKSLAAFSASPVSIDAPTEPEAPKARRSSLSRTEALSA